MSDVAVLAMLDAIEAAKLRYLVVGSMSVNLYAYPRSTKDADIVLEPAPQLAKLLRELPPDIRLDPQIRFETVTGTTRYILYLKDNEFKIELFLLSDDPHDQARFERRIERELLGRRTWVPTPEDVVITKLRWSRQGRRAKDLADAKGLIAIQGNTLDWKYIEQWCDQHGTRALLDEIRSNAPRS